LHPAPPDHHHRFQSTMQSALWTQVTGWGPRLVWAPSRQAWVPQCRQGYHCRRRRRVSGRLHPEEQMKERQLVEEHQLVDLDLQGQARGELQTTLQPWSQLDPRRRLAHLRLLLHQRLPLRGHWTLRLHCCQPRYSLHRPPLRRQPPPSTAPHSLRPRVSRSAHTHRPCRPSTDTPPRPPRPRPASTCSHPPRPRRSRRLAHQRPHPSPPQPTPAAPHCSRPRTSAHGCDCGRL
jgi:hypothetical protein